jgi:mannose-6-phosphate isomerase-like protein (cupin superfamily)
VYSDQEFALVLRKAAELARGPETRGDPSGGLTLEDMKAAAAEAGFDPVLVERAARLVPIDATSESLFARIIGGAVRSEQQASYPTPLGEDGARRLLSAVRSVAGHRGVGDSSERGIRWVEDKETSELLVTADADPDGTSVAVSIDRRTGFLLTALASGGGIFASFLIAIGVAQETSISPYLALATGSIGTLALARGLWAAWTRRAEQRVAALMESIDRTMRGRDTTRSTMLAATQALPKANLAEKLWQISQHWTPRLAARVNDTDVKLVKLQGEFVWHKHDQEDELFVVLKGRLLMQFRDREEWVEEGEFILVPRGVEHRPVAPEEVHVMLVEPSGTLNTGDVRTELTVDVVEPI